MNRIDDLIGELCPNGVEHRALGEVGELIRGRRFTKADYVDEGLGSIHYGDIYTAFGTWATEVGAFVRPELKASLRLARTGDLVIAATGESVNEVCKAVAWLGADEVAVHDDCYIFRHSLDPKFVAYFFQSRAFHDQKTRFVTESKLARISGANLAKIRIPVPPTAIQREVVAILDELEPLQAEIVSELEVEVDDRSSQYAYYRSSLLTVDDRDDVRWATLGELAEIGTGSRNTNEGNAEGAYPFYVRSQEVRYMDDWQFDETAVITSGDGVGVGKVFHFAQGRYALHQRAYRIRPTTADLNPKYFFYYFRNSFLAYMEKAAVRSSVTSVRRPMLERFPVPLPDPQRQAGIVAVLDKFDGLVNDLSRELTAEIAARRKQYEYYRDKLLTFEERVA